MLLQSCIARYRSVAHDNLGSRRHGVLTNDRFQHPTNHTAPCCAVPFLACVRSPISIPGRSPSTTLNFEKMDSAWLADRLVTRLYIARFNCRNRLNVGNLILRKDMFNECGFREFPTRVCSLRVGSSYQRHYPTVLGIFYDNRAEMSRLLHLCRGVVLVFRPPPVPSSLSFFFLLNFILSFLVAALKAK